MEQPTKPRVLFVYYSYTGQTKRVIDAMAEVFRERGYEVREAPIAFTDKRWVERFSHRPMRARDLLGMLLPQIRGATVEVHLPVEARESGADLVVIGSPTWFFRTSIPIRSFLKSPDAGKVLDGRPFTVFVVCRRYWSTNFGNVRKHGVRLGGTFIDGTHFRFQGGQIRSLLALISYLYSDQIRERYFGIRIPPTNLQPEQIDEARAFANRLADGLPVRP